MSCESLLKKSLPLINAFEIRQVEYIQSLWNDYGKIIRINTNSPLHPIIIGKYVKLEKKDHHPRGWNTHNSHQRKIRSYNVELNFYQDYSNLLNQETKRLVPKYLGSKKIKNELIFLLEDLDELGFVERKNKVSREEAFACLSWLASFHAQYINVHPKNLWKIGTYWHLDTRRDELAKIDDDQIKCAAPHINTKLNGTKYKTLVHGDAKIANFCFNPISGDVAAVDFQYVGGGCGIKDVAYFLGSAVDEENLKKWENDLVNYYFKELTQRIDNNDKKINLNQLESDWRELWPFAWADFYRFLMGWRPGHWKINSYSKKMFNTAVRKLKIDYGY